MKHCESCNQPWPSGQEHPGTFARFPFEDMPDRGDIETLLAEQRRLSDFASVVFHSIFCVWRYEEENLGKVQHESIANLTCLGEQLCREIARYESRIGCVATLARDNGIPASVPSPTGQVE